MIRLAQLGCVLAQLLACLPLAQSAYAGQAGQDAVQEPAKAEDFDTRLQRQPFFKKILWSTDASFAPFEIVVQKQTVPEPNYEKSVVQFFGPWLVQMSRLFEERVAKPAMLPPGGDPRPIRLVVLTSQGDFVNFCQTVHTYDGLDQTAFYDDRLRAVVTYWDVPGAPFVRRYPVLRRFVFALLQQRSTAFESRQAPLWLREGLGSALAWHTGADPATAFATAGVDPKLLQLMVGLSQDASKQNRFLMPLASLAEQRSFADLRKHAQQAARQSGVEFDENSPWYTGYFCQSALWVEFLRREGAPLHNTAFNTYLRAGLRGGGSPADLAKAFEGIDLAALDQEFFRWAYLRARAANLAAPDDARLATLFQQTPKPVASDSGLAQAAGSLSLAMRLAVPPEDLRGAHALALRKAASGDIDGALGDLTLALERGGDSRALAQVRVELERLQAWQLARDGWLAEQVKTGGRLQFERAGKAVTRKISGVADGQLSLESAQGSESLAISTLPPGLLAAQMKTLPPGSPDWVRCYAWILSEDPRWEKQLRDKSEAAQALRADAERTYAELRRLGNAVAHLNELAQNSSPADAQAAEHVLELLRDTLREIPPDPLLVARMPSLLELGRLAASLIHDRDRPKPEFACKTIWIDPDTVELEYHFESESELDDWLQTPVSPEEWRFTMEPLTTPPEQRGFAVRNGAWSGVGAAILTHRIPFEAPMNVVVVLRHGFAADPQTSIGHFLVGLCSGPAQGHVAFAEGGESFLFELATGKRQVLPSSNLESVPLGDPVTLEIAHDGSRTRFVHQGTTEPELPPTSLRSGELFVLAQTDRVVLLDSIKIRAKLNAAALKQLRERWIAKRLREIGLP